MPPAKQPVSLLICDGQQLLREAITFLVAADPALQLAAQSLACGESVVAAAETHRPDVVLLDAHLPGHVDGFEATRRITSVSPGTKVVMMAGAGDPDDLLVRALEAGATTVVPKTAPAATLLGTIRAAAHGEPIVDGARLVAAMRRVAAVRAARLSDEERAGRLSKREWQILRRIADGDSNEDIAQALYLSNLTVQCHVRNVLSKIEVHSRLAAVVWATKAGVLG